MKAEKIGRNLYRYDLEGVAERISRNIYLSCDPDGEKFYKNREDGTIKIEFGASCKDAD